MAKQTLHLGRRWYVLHTYSGYEENVKRNLEQRIESFDMQDKIFGVLVPKEKKIKIKSGKRTVIEEKIFPGYVLVEMIVTDDSWYVVRNTPNVTGFVGAGTTPIPVSPQEIDNLKSEIAKRGVEIVSHPEVFTTLEARRLQPRRLRSGSRLKRRESKNRMTDASAAALILKSFIDTMYNRDV